MKGRPSSFIIPHSSFITFSSGERGGAEREAVAFGHRDDAARRVGDDVAGLALGDDEAVGGAYNLVAEADGAAAQLRDVRADDHLVVVLRGGLVAAVAFGD